VRFRERGFRDIGHVMRVPFKTLNVLKGTLKTSSPARCAGRAGETDQDHRTLNDLNGPFATPHMSRTRLSRHGTHVTCRNDQALRGLVDLGCG